MGKRPEVDHEQTARDVLARRLDVSAGQLVELVHAVNPTGRLSSKADERRRYDLKSRLQSLLIERFADAIEVREQPGGIVAIRHKYVSRDACHARLDELEPEARSTVRRLLDAGTDDSTPAPQRASKSTSTGAPGVLEHGHRALAEFDYETARTCFEQATDAGDLAGARALLGLLVDHLVLDADALEVGDRLSPTIVADSEVRALLGLAAARSKRWSDATAFLRELHVVRAADGRALLARAALERCSWDELALELRALERCDAAHPDLHALRDDAARARERARKPAEEELLQLLERDPGAAEMAARALVERWPDSAIAGRVLGRIQSDRRQSEGERLRELALQELADGQLARAGELARQAGALGVAVDSVLEQIRSTALAARAERDSAAIQRARDLLGIDLGSGLRAYAELEAELRRRVREHETRPELRWLDIVVDHARRARSGDGADAVLALTRAQVVSDDEAVKLMAPYEELLAPVPVARELRAAIQRRAAARRRSAAADALTAAAEALRASDFAQCEQLCVAIDPRDLEPDAQARHEQMVEMSRGKRAIDHARVHAHELAETGDFLAARRELVALLSNPMLDEDCAADVRERLATVQRRLQSAWRVRSVPCARPLDDGDPIGELLGRLPYEEHVMHWLTDERDLVVVGAYGRDIHIMWISVEHRSVVRRAYVHAPERIGELTAICVDRDELWLAGTSFLLQVDIVTAEPRRWESLGRFVDGRVERVFALPGASHLWIDAYDPKRSTPFRIVDLNRWQVVREVPSARSMHPVVGNGKLAMLGIPFDGGAVLQSERGTILEALPACDGQRVSFGAFDPRGNLVVGVGGIDDDDAAIYLRGITAGRFTYDYLLPNSHPDLRISGATAAREDMMFVSYATTLEGSCLVGLRFGDRTLEPLWSSTGSDVLLVQDASAREVVCLAETRARVELFVMSAEPPRLPALDPTAPLPSTAGYFSCCPHDESEVTRANRAAREDDWIAVRNQLEPLVVESLSPAEAAHRYHLLGLALLRTGGLHEDVRTLWTRGAELDGGSDRYLDCGFESLLQLIDEPVTEAPTHELRRCVVRADEHFGHDPRAALAAIRRRVVTRHQEPQSFARLVEAWLALEAHDDERFDKAIALSRYLECRPGHALPIPDGWSAAQLHALGERARAWLERWRADPEAG
ncbi:MAG: hypothetical protein ACKV2T_17290 [Kofleriaceae bacterium]